MYSCTTSRRESVQACHYSLFIFTSEKPETKWEKPKTTTSTKSEKPLVFLPETENQVLIEGKRENRRRHQNQKTAFLLLRKPKNRSKKWPKPKTPKPPSCFFFISPLAVGHEGGTKSQPNKYFWSRCQI